MTREQVWKAVSDRLRRDFGRLLEVRDVRRVRRVAGDAWTVVVVLAAPSGDLHVADLNVDDSGDLSLGLDGDSVIEAVRRAERASMRPPDPSEELVAFAEDLVGDDTGDLGPALALLTETDLEARIEAALERND
jgi:hypothetical protein